jgi:ankyrin repeat protein
MTPFSRAVQASVLAGALLAPVGAQAQATCSQGTIMVRSPSRYFSSQQSLRLLAAVRAGDESGAQAAIAAGASPNEEGPIPDQINRMRLLHYAISVHDANAVRLLIKLGADPELHTMGLGSPLAFAVHMNQVTMISAVLDAKPFSSLSRQGQSDLVFTAVDWGRPEVLALLLDRGAPVDIRGLEDDTPLLRAISAMDMTMAQQLLQRGASPWPTSARGNKALDLVRILLRKESEGSAERVALMQLAAQLEEKMAGGFPAH